MLQAFHVCCILIGALIVLSVLGDVFEVIVLPRRIVRRLRIAVIFYRLTWGISAAVARRVGPMRWRDWFLSLYGPLSLLALLAVWAIGAIGGFGLIMYGLQAPLTNAPQPSYLSYVYLSGVTFFTLGYGDLAPTSPEGRAVAVIEAGTGLGLLAIVIGYLPVIYQSFSRRESVIALLDARAGSPPSAERLLRRHIGQMAAFEQLLRDWELWSAELLESHISYPVLCYFRSQHDNQSWVTALSTILDACVLTMAVLESGPSFQAQLTFAMARHALVDLAQVVNAPPRRDQADRLPREQLDQLLERLRQAGLAVHGMDCCQRLDGLRKMYEPFAQAMSDRLFYQLPSWAAAHDGMENWQTSAWDRITSADVARLVRDPSDDHDM